MDPITRFHLRQLGFVAVVSMVAGSGYTLAGGFTDARSLAEGAVTGLFIGVPLASFLIFVVRGRRGAGLRRAPFALVLAVETLVYAGVIGLVLGTRIAGVVVGQVPVAEIGPGPKLAEDLIFALLVSLAFNFVLEVGRLLGPRTLLHFLTGRYYRPRAEGRMFLFLDLVGSTAAAERLGPLRFHGLLDRVFGLLTEPVLRFGAEIYRYVGDEVIITWDCLRSGGDPRPIGCYAAILARLNEAASAFEQDYGFVPSFRASLHAGPVVVGEIGELKKEIAFLGDAVNTAARIEEACRDLGRDLILSKAALDRLAMPVDFNVVPLGRVHLRGKREELELYALETGEAAPAARAAVAGV